MSGTITTLALERLEKIVVDTKKVFHYSKHTGYWTWSDKGETPTWEQTFDTRLEALLDAVEPYTSEDLESCLKEN